MTSFGGFPQGRRGLAIAVAVAALAIAWVLGTLAAGSAAETGAAAQASRAKNPKTVAMVNFAYKPGTATVARGARVTFSNTSGSRHTATGSGFDTGVVRPGRSASLRFNRRGTFAFHCTLHPFMRGKVVVK